MTQSPVVESGDQRGRSFDSILQFPRIHKRGIKSKKIAQTRFKPASDRWRGYVVSPLANPAGDSCHGSLSVRKPEKKEGCAIAALLQVGDQVEIVSFGEGGLEAKVMPGFGQFPPRSLDNPAKPSQPLGLAFQFIKPVDQGVVERALHLAFHQLDEPAVERFGGGDLDPLGGEVERPDVDRLGSDRLAGPDDPVHRLDLLERRDDRGSAAFPAKRAARLEGAVELRRLDREVPFRPAINGFQDIPDLDQGGLDDHVMRGDRWG